MRRLISRGYRTPVADDCTLPGVNDKPQSTTTRAVEDYGVSGATYPVVFDYARLDTGGDRCDGQAFMVEGWSLNTNEYFQAWYFADGTLGRGWGEFESRTGPYPIQLTKWFMNQIIMRHSAVTGGNPRDTYNKFAIRGLATPDNVLLGYSLYCTGCSATYVNDRHARYHGSCCPDRRLDRIPER